MNFEERERAKRKRMIKVVIAEIGMVFSVVAIVVVAVMAAMGFFVTSDGSIEQMGLAQIHSIPTGGTVTLDGTTLFSRTNLTRSMAAGEHEIKIARDNYDTWSKKIKMHSGMLMRLYYPRLFLLNRKAEKVLNMGEPMVYSVSRNKMNILVAEKESTTWNLLNIRGDEVQTTKLNLAKVLPGVEKSKFGGTVEIVEWSNDGEFVLIKTLVDKKSEWILLNLKDVEKSLNLSKTFGLEFERVEMVDNSAGQMYALENGHLRKINTGDQSISRVLLDEILDFNNDGLDVIFVKREVENKVKKKQIGTYRDGEKDGVILATVADEVAAKAAISEYYGEKYMIFVMDDKISVLYGAMPSYREEAPQSVDILGLKTLVSELKLKVVPQNLELGVEGEYVVMRKAGQFMVLDLDMGDLYEYEPGTERLGWLSDGMMYGVINDGLEIWDFDYTNRRTLVKYVAETKAETEAATDDTTKAEAKDNGADKEEDGAQVEAVTTLSHNQVASYDVAISNNNKWLYYVVRDDAGKLNLVREKVRD